MGHEELVMANGPMAGKPLKRRYTDVWQKTGEGYVLIARQATYIGIDGGAVRCGLCGSEVIVEILTLFGEFPDPGPTPPATPLAFLREVA
jgi:hypothetical protein